MYVRMYAYVCMEVDICLYVCMYVCMYINACMLNLLAPELFFNFSTSCI